MFSNLESTQVVFSKPKILFMVAAFLSLVLSVTLWYTGSKDQGIFVGLWVPSILSLGTLVLTNDRSAQ
ncbi:MAG TPA: hypothetical protein DCP89_03815 [Acidimicrobiaceae bacterium]|nr:hypothetical protein [Actinomycetota bacterium]MDG1196643.1 hypothetical protein [Actinomycetota bacterium]MDG2120868.1 hypothetical protein [Actinomycetota bacterium]HAN07605.1 hypothetical protein [Acidimicrobiaceae bacterium]